MLRAARGVIEVNPAPFKLTCSRTLSTTQNRTYDVLRTGLTFGDIAR